MGKLHLIGWRDYDGLVKEAGQIAQTYAADAAMLPDDPRALYERVRLIPYVRETVETLKRPAVTLRDGGDCDDKTILIKAWAIMHSIPCRAVLAGIKKEPGKYHHIFPELFMGGHWVTFDATYDWNKLGVLMPSYDNFKLFEKW